MLRTLYREFAGHPYELNLVMDHIESPDDRAAQVAAIHENTGEYAALHYYVDRLDISRQRLLVLLALLDEPETENALSMISDLFRQEHDWRDDNIGELLAGMKGLVEESQEKYYILPVVRHHVLSANPPQFLDVATKDDYHKKLAQLFSHCAESISKQIKTLHESRRHVPDNQFRDLSAGFIHFSYKAARQALMQRDIGLAALLVQEVLHHSAGQVDFPGILGLLAKLNHNLELDSNRFWCGTRRRVREEPDGESARLREWLEERLDNDELRRIVEAIRDGSESED